MAIGITGATGQLGRLVVEHLEGKVNKEELIALVRSPEKAEDLGITARSFDYTQAEELSASLLGIDTLLLISGNEIGKRVEQHKNVITAAKEAGVKHIVYTSLLKADSSSSLLAPEHLLTEEAIKESGLAYTILRNGWYTENYAASIPGALQAGAFIGAAGDGKISSAARVDYAIAAAVVLSTSGHQGKTYELAGDTFYTLTELAAELSKQAGKTIPYTNLTETEYAEALRSAGLPDGLAHAFTSFDTSAANNDLYSSSSDLSTLIDRPTTSLAETIRETLSK